MRVDILSRKWGGPDGGPDGMAIAAAYLAWTLCEMGHDVHGYVGSESGEPWQHPRMTWRRRVPLFAPDDFSADLVVSVISPAWRRTALAAEREGARARTVYWHHHAEVPGSFGCALATAAIERGTRDLIALPPSSWAADAPGGAPHEGTMVLLPGASRPKGGAFAVQVARKVTEAKWYVLPGRGSSADLAPWRQFGHVEVAPGPVRPIDFLSRARVVVSPTRAEVHPLTLVEAAVRGIPIVCTDLPGTRAATGGRATFLAMTAPPEAWADAIQHALRAPMPEPLRLPRYADTVAAFLQRMKEAGAAMPATIVSRPAPVPVPSPPRIAVSARQLAAARRPPPPISAAPSSARSVAPASVKPWKPRVLSGLPRVLVLADVENWAWGRKARALKEHLAGRIDVTVAYSTSRDTSEIIRSQQHDLYHTFEVIQVGTIPAGYPMVTGITAHVCQNWDKQRGPGTVRKWAARGLGFHANSRMLQREMEAYLGRPVFYVPNGVDEAFWTRSRPRSSTRLVVGNVARPNARKGPEIIAAACARAGVELRTIHRTSHNALSPEEVREFYQEIHVLAVSSDMDGTPNPALEAASCECAVVSNAIGNMPEFIEHGSNGLLTERTTDSLAEALASLAARPLDEVEEMGHAARATVLGDWTWAKRSVAYAEMWESVLGVRRGTVAA